jgi:uncharacterized membrane protein
MIVSLRSLSLVLALLATGLLAGFFYAYSSSVNQGLGDLDDAAYIAAMQSINDAVPNGVFVVSFIGAPVTLALAAVLHARDRSPRLPPLLVATGLVFVGGLLVTFAANVPLNDELAAVELTAAPDVLARARADYEDPWNTWNAIRAAACTAALGCVGWALLTRPAGRPPTVAAHAG